MKADGSLKTETLLAIYDIIKDMKKSILLLSLLIVGCESNSKPDLNRVPKIHDPEVPKIHTSSNNIHNNLWAGPDFEVASNNLK